MMGRVINKCTLLFLLATTCLRAEQTLGQGEQTTHSLMDKLGYRFSFYSFSKYDSNVLKNTSQKRDLGGFLYPSLELNYPVSSSSQISVKYLYGMQRLVSTSFLNTASHSAYLSLTNKFTPSLKAHFYGAMVKSSQPDILNMRSLYSFASYVQSLEGIKFDWIKTPATLFSIAYSTHQRQYRMLQTASFSKQRDFLNSFRLTYAHLFTPKMRGFVQLGYQVNSSNNHSYRYSESYLKAYISRTLRHGVKLEFLQKTGSLRFSNRMLSNNPSIRRNDLIATSMFGLKKRLNNHVTLNAQYYFQKDFSNERFRKYHSHIALIGLEMLLKRKASAPPAEEGTSVSSSTPFPVVEELNPRILANSGYDFLLKGQYDEALEYSLKALSLDPTITEAHINAGIAYYRKGELNKALNEWKTALKLDSTNAKVRKLVEKIKAEMHRDL